MSTTSAFPHINKMIEQFSVVPENKQGLPNWRHKASGIPLVTQVVVDTLTGIGRDDLNLDGAPNDFLNGLQIYWKTGALAGTVIDIVDTAAGVGTVTLTTNAMSVAPAAADEFYILNAIGFSNISLAATYDQTERTFVTKTLDKPPVLKGAKRWSGSFDAEMYGLATPLPNAAVATIDRTAQMLAMFGQSRSYVGDIIIAGSTTTSINLTAGGTFAIGDLVMIDGEIRKVIAVVPGGPSIDLDIALSAAPAAAVVVYGAEEWTPDDTGHRTATLVHLIDDQLTEYYGGLFSFKAAATWGSVIMWSLTVSGGDWLLEDAVDFEATESILAPIEMLVGDNYYNATELCVNSFEFDQAAELSEITDTCSGLAFGVRGRTPALKFVWRDKDAVPKNNWEALDTLAGLRAAFGNTPSRAVAFTGQVQPGDVAYSDVNNTMYWDSAFMMRDAFQSLTHTPPRIYRF